MGANTKIEWAHHTFNPWIGCTKIGPGCDNCYAEKLDTRFHANDIHWGSGVKRKRTSKSNWKLPIMWNREAQIKIDAWEKFKESNPGLEDKQLVDRGFVKPERPRVFCASMADVFDNEVPAQWRLDLISLILKTPYLDWLILTKRIGNAEKMLDDALGIVTGGLWFWRSGPTPIGFKNLWLGATVCNQEEAERDIPKLLAIPAAKRFLSIEPMLGNIDVFSNITGELLHTSGNDYEPGWLDWVIVGGESGRNARPMHPAWVRKIRDQCVSAGVRFFFKQWGEWSPYANESHYSYSAEEKHAHAWVDSNDGAHGKCWIIDDDGTWSNFTGNPLNDENEVRESVHIMGRYGKKAAGRLLDGRTWDEVPE